MAAIDYPPRRVMLEKLEPATLASRATEKVLAYIRDSGLQAGSVLPSIEKLAGMLGVSRPIVREALKALEGCGIVEIINGKGAVVREAGKAQLNGFFSHLLHLRPESIRELIEVRRGLEMQSAMLAAVRADQAERETLQKTLADMRAAMGDACSDDYTSLDMTLHLQIASASHNSILLYLTDSIRDALRRSISEGWRMRRSHEELARGQALHETLVEAVVAGNANAAGLAMAAHFDDVIWALDRAEREHA